MSPSPKDIPSLTLRAQITIEIAVRDYVEAAEHQRRAEALFAAVSAEYAAATFSFHHLRTKPADDGEAKIGGRPRRYRTRPSTLAVYHDG